HMHRSSAMSFESDGDLGEVPSLPTRRSSDLGAALRGEHRRVGLPGDRAPALGGAGPSDHRRRDDRPEPGDGQMAPHHPGLAPGRSEEHTSELQSRENLVCRLLLEKKNKNEEM